MGGKPALQIITVGAWGWDSDLHLDSHSPRRCSLYCLSSRSRSHLSSSFRVRACVDQGGKRLAWRAQRRSPRF